MSEILLTSGEPNPAAWIEIDDDTQAALIEWYNIREEDLDADDLKRLASLYHDGKFEYGECTECGEKWCDGRPDDWGNFQGIMEGCGHMGKICAPCYLGAKRIMDEAGIDIRGI